MRVHKHDNSIKVKLATALFFKKRINNNSCDLLNYYICRLQQSLDDKNLCSKPSSHYHSLAFLWLAFSLSLHVIASPVVTYIQPQAFEIQTHRSEFWLYHFLSKLFSGIIQNNLFFLNHIATERLFFTYKSFHKKVTKCTRTWLNDNQKLPILFYPKNLLFMKPRQW